MYISPNRTFNKYRFSFQLSNSRKSFSRFKIKISSFNAFLVASVWADWINFFTPHPCRQFMLDNEQEFASSKNLHQCALIINIDIKLGWAQQKFLALLWMVLQNFSKLDNINIFVHDFCKRNILSTFQEAHIFKDFCYKMYQLLISNQRSDFIGSFSMCIRLHYFATNSIVLAIKRVVDNYFKVML